MASGIDYSFLTRTVTTAEVRAFRSSPQTRERYTNSSSVAQTVALALFFVVFAVIAVVILATIGGALVSVLASDSSTAAVIAAIVLGSGIVVCIIAIVRWSTRRRWEKLFRLDGFATTNSLTFSSSDSAPQYPGAIFSSGRSREARDHLRSTTGRFLDYGNYRYVTGSGKNQSTHNWGFLAFQLDRSLPHMVLDSRANNGLFGGTNLPSAFDKDQILSLEGDFDSHFTLYCPRAYERDALYVFTPDLMALLIDNAAPFDVEIVDKWMFVYSATPFDMVQPTAHQRLLGIVDTVGAKTLAQSDRYSDERVQDFPANVVAQPGKRLKKRFPLAAIIIVGIVLIWFFVIPFITGAIATLGR